MKTLISSYAHNHFGVLIDAARTGPAAVTENGKPFVMVAVEEYERLKALEKKHEGAFGTLKIGK